LTDAAAERLAAERRRLDSLAVPLRRLAVGHATVDLDDAEAALRASAAAEVTSAADDELLGGRARIAASKDGETIVLLEPYTEGRLAASLARFGHGPIVEYLEAADDDDVTAAAAAAGIVLSAVRAGPFGPQRLVVGGKPWGPHIILVDRSRAATIES
jgi:hypothetical protein